VNAESTGAVVRVDEQNYKTAFMYGRERQLLVHVISSVKEGDLEGVLCAMDEFWAHQFGMKGTQTWTIRKDMLDSTIREKQPSICLELGTYCGYSALRIAKNLPANGRLVSVEVDPLFSAIATKIIEYAGMAHKVKVVTGTVETRMARLKACLAQATGGSARCDFILCDHSKDRFVPDLDLLEQAGVVGEGTIVMGDTTIYPGDATAASDLLSHVATNSHYVVKEHRGTEQAYGITVCEWHYMV